MCPAAQRSDDAQLYVDQLCQGEARVAQANTFIQAFLALVRERRGGDLEAWRATVMQSEIEELARFAQGLQEDLSAIQAGLTLEWSNGITEGQIHRIPSGAPTLPVNWLRAYKRSVIADTGK